MLVLRNANLQERKGIIVLLFNILANNTPILVRIVPNTNFTSFKKTSPSLFVKGLFYSLDDERSAYDPQASQPSGSSNEHCIADQFSSTTPPVFNDEAAALAYV